MSQKLLIIDDERWFFEPLLDRLDYEGIDYEYCFTGFDGLNKLKANDYKAVILDMKLTLGDELLDVSVKYDVPGIYVLEEIRKHSPDLSVICYTVLSDNEVSKKIENLKATYIRKGVNEDELFREIYKHIEPKNGKVLETAD